MYQPTVSPPPDPLSATKVEATTADTHNWDVKDNQTVSGQMDNLLKSDSPYMKQAETQGKQFAAGRGLLNSSMAAGAAQGAAIERALPIAQQDAGTFANSAQFNADAGNRVGMFNADSQNLAGRFNADASNDMAKTNFQAEQQRNIQSEGFVHDAAMFGLQIDANNSQIPMQFAGNLSTTITNGVNAIIADGTLSATAKQAAIKNLIDYGNSQLSWASAFYGATIPNLSTPTMA